MNYNSTENNNDKVILFLSIISILTFSHFVEQPLILSISGSSIILLTIFLFIVFFSNAFSICLLNFYYLLFFVSIFSILTMLSYISEYFTGVIFKNTNDLHRYTIFNFFIYLSILFVNIIIFLRIIILLKKTDRNIKKAVKPFVLFLEKIIIGAFCLGILGLIISIISSLLIKYEHEIFTIYNLNIGDILSLFSMFLIILAIIILMIYFFIFVLFKEIKTFAKEKTNLFYFFIIPLFVTLPIIKPANLFFSNNNVSIFVLFFVVISLISSIWIYIKNDYIFNIKVMSLTILYCLVHSRIASSEAFISNLFCYSLCFIIFLLNLKTLYIDLNGKIKKRLIYFIYLIEVFTIFIFKLNQTLSYPFNLIFYSFLFLSLAVFIISTEKTIKRQTEKFLS